MSPESKADIAIKIGLRFAQGLTRKQLIDWYKRTGQMVVRMIDEKISWHERKISEAKNRIQYHQEEIKRLKGGENKKWLN